MLGYVSVNESVGVGARWYLTAAAVRGGFKCVFNVNKSVKAGCRGC